jgi:hypothetical protein
MSVAAPPPSRLRLFVDSLQSLWVSGLAVLIVVLVATLLGEEGEKLKRTQYFALGTGFPALVASCCFGLRFTLFAQVHRWLALGLAIFLIGSLAFCLGRHWNWYVGLLGAGQWLITSLVVWRTGGGSADTKKPVSASSTPLRLAFVGVFVATVAWIISIQILGHRLEDGLARFKEGATDWLGSRDLADRILGDRFFVVALAVSFLLVLANLVSYHCAAPGRRRALGYQLIGYAQNVVALFVFAIYSFRTDHILEARGPDAYFHWAFYLNPAEDVRQGAWLLWDIPSNYGFLSVLILSVLPTKSTWQSLYLLNSLLIFLSAAFVFFVWRAVRTGPLNGVFALALSFASVFMVPGTPDMIPDAVMTPAVGAYRYIWCYALLAVLWWDLWRSIQGAPSGAARWVGMAVWVIGAWWSLESAVFCAAIWLPAYALAVARDCKNLPVSYGRGKLIGLIIWRLSIPVWLWAISLGGMVLYYRLFLGHGPDPSAFAEVARQFIYPYSDYVGRWLWLAVFCGLASGGVCLFRRWHEKPAPLAWGVWATFWVTSSYYAVKTDLGILLTLSPLILAGLGLVLWSFDRLSVPVVTVRRVVVPAGWARPAAPSPTRTRRIDETLILTSLFIPIVTVILAAGFRNIYTVIRRVPEIKLGYQAAERQLPTLDPSARELLAQTKFQNEDRLSFLEDALMLRPGWPGNHSMAPKNWLPVGSWRKFQETLFTGEFAADKRLASYVRRFTDRVRTTGYLLCRRGRLDDPDLKWLFDPLRSRYAPNKVGENTDYELIRFDPH